MVPFGSVDHLVGDSQTQWRFGGGSVLDVIHRCANLAASGGMEEMDSAYHHAGNCGGDGVRGGGLASLWDVMAKI